MGVDRRPERMAGACSSGRQNKSSVGPISVKRNRFRHNTNVCHVFTFDKNVSSVT